MGKPLFVYSLLSIVSLTFALVTHAGDVQSDSVRAEEERLRVQHNNNFPYAQAHLKQAGSLEGELVIDINVRTGLMLPLFSRMVGKSGTVIGVASSIEHLQRAQAYVHEQGLTNVVLLIADISTHDVHEKLADFRKPKLIFSQFLLMHQCNVVGVMANIKSLLADGGQWFVEETAADLAGSSHHNQLFADYFSFCRRMSAMKGTDYDAYKKIPEHADMAGLRVVKNYSDKKPVTVGGF